ncbi:MAG: PAS domain-containing protein [[Clostridium] scindens]
MKREDDGTRLLYAVYSDVSQQVWLENERQAPTKKMQDIVDAIPGGVAIYKVSDIFETVYFSDGVPQSFLGIRWKNTRRLIKQDAAGLTYKEDTQKVVDKAMEVIRTRGIAEIEFRKQHREGYIVWVRAQMKYIGEQDGCPLIHCVFHNISNQKETELELSHLVNSIPGGIASYRVEGEKFIPTFFSDGVMMLSGHSREEYKKMIRNNVLDIIYEPDRERVFAAAKAAVISGDVLDVSYRMRHKDGSLIWIHLNGRRMGPVSENARFYAVFTGMSAETRLFQSIANETADGIYVIDKENYDLLYVNESKELFKDCKDSVGRKCYQALQGRSEPCSFCSLKTQKPDGEEHEMWVEEKGEYYKTRFKETEWNGIPAYIKFVRDVTQEVEMRKEKERLEQYFQTLVRHLPGGVAVVRYEKDGAMIPEFISDGFAAMTEMDMDDAWELYSSDAMAGVHPEDRERVRKAMEKYIAGCDSSYEIVYRIKKARMAICG